MKVATKEFARSARRHRVTDLVLCETVKEADAGLIEADLGSRLIKQRIARESGGKRGGYRAVIYYRRRQRAVFLHLFPKNAKGNLTPKELEAYRDFAKSLDALTDEQLMALIKRRAWRMIEDDEPEEDVPK